MKILLCLNTLSPNSGGTYTFENEVLKVLSLNNTSNKHSFYILCSEPIKIKNITDILITRNSFTRIHFFLKRKINGLSAFLFNKKVFYIESIITSKVSEYDLDCVYYLSPFINYKIDLPYIATIHDLQHIKQSIFPEVSLSNVFEIRDSLLTTHLRKAASIISCSNVGKDEIKTIYGIPESKITVIHHPTPSYTLQTQGKDFNNIISKFNLRSKYLFYPAQFWAHKNHVCLIDALKLLVNEGLDFDLVLVGSDKGNLDFIKEYSRATSISDNVKFLGFVSESDLIELYKNAFAMVYASYFGPENLPPLEAFSLNCPVVASNVDGAFEQLEDAALYFSPNDPEECKIQILKLLDTSLKEAQIRKGKELSERRSLSSFASELMTHFDHLETNIRTWKRVNLKSQ